MPPRKRADQETGSGLRRRTRGGGGQKSSKASTDVAPVSEGGQSVGEEESVGDINCNKKDNSLFTALEKKKGKFDVQEKSTKNGEGTRDVGRSVRNRKLATSKTETIPEGNADTKTNRRKRKLSTADIKDGPRPGKERKRKDNLNGLGSTKVQKKLTAGRSKKTNKASKDDDIGSLVKREVSEDLILGADAKLEKTDIDCEDVGVMSSNDSSDEDKNDDDDDFEPVVKKMKSPVIKGSDKVRAARGKKVKGNISLPGSEEVNVKTKNTPARKKQRTKVEETKQEGDTKISQRIKTTKTRKKISEKHSSNSLESEFEKSCDSNVHINSEKATPCQADLKKIDQSDVMSVLLHMEGGSERPGPSGLSLGGEGSEGESDGGSEEESDWEEVKDLGGSPQKSQIPKEPVEVILEAPNFLKKRKKKGFDWKAYVQRQINRFNKELREDIHKVHLMCLLMRGRYLNQLCNDLDLWGIALSLIPAEVSRVPAGRFDVPTHTRFVNWYKETVSIDQKIAGDSQANLVENLTQRMETRKVANRLEFVLVYLIMLRCLGVESRLVTSLQPLPLKNTKQEESTKKINIKGNPAAIKKPGKTKTKAESSAERKEDVKSRKKSRESKNDKPKQIKKPVVNAGNTLQTKNKQLRKRGSKVRPDSYHDNSEADDSGDDFVPEEGSGSEGEEEESKGRKGKSSRGPQEQKSSPDSMSSEDSDFMEETVHYRSPLRKSVSGKKRRNNKVVSSDSESDQIGSNQGCDEWVEVFIEAENSWMCIDCLRGHINRPYRIESAATQPVHYVVAYNQDGRWKDVTARYASQWMTDTRKLRVDPEWWRETLEVFRCEGDSTEDEEIKANLMKRPMPSSVSAYKNHPLYALRRHLLKYEAIYPNTAAPLGYIRGEPVYARECVHELHSRENWLKEGRAVRIGEEAYKMVKSRAKWNKPKLDPEALDLELFGLWQTEVYIPPPAVDGKVPRNAYGNVELFKESMLPAGTVYLKVPGLNKVAKKLNMDCVPAMVGWDSHCGFSHPVLEGFVVCEEHKDILLAAWDEEQEIQKQKEAEKREKRAFGNWKLLIKGLLIKERIKKRFNLIDKDEEPKVKEKTKGKLATDAEKSWPQKNRKSKNLSHNQETL
ncbi:DNA repair protein complementing XP-C cells-like isoform X2 [Crassostrea virginica]